MWTRLPATFLVLTILYEIWHDRRGEVAAVVFGASLTMVVLAVVLLISGQQVVEGSRHVAGWLAIVAATVFGQGIIHQILQVRRSGHTGAISLRMHQLTTCKDISTVAFALSMPLDQGWPLMAVGFVGVATKSVLMWHFRWARLRSPNETGQ